MTAHIPLRATLAVFGLPLVILMTLFLARPAAADVGPVPGDWQLPLPGSPTVLRPFDPPAKKWSAGHRGVDLAAAVGTDVLAAGAGVVWFAGRVAGRGVVSIKHGDLRTTYLPVRASVRAGESVSTGDVIGTVVADRHCEARGCLHWGLLRGDTYLDPMTLLRATAPRLLPVWGIPPGAPADARPTSTPTWGRVAVSGRRDAGPTTGSSPRSEKASTQGAPSREGAVGAVAATTAGAVGIAAVAGRRARTSRPPSKEPP